MTRSWLLFVSISVSVAAVLSSIRGLWSPEGLTTATAAISLVVGAVVSGFCSSKQWRRWIATFWLRAHFYSRALFLIFFIGSSMSFFFLFSEVNGKWGTASPNNLGDLPYHVHLINFFARGAHFPPMDPTFAGERLHYPYGIDLWDALWVKVGVPLSGSLVITGVLALFVTLIALWKLGDQFLACAFILSGGLALSLDWGHTFGPTSPLEWKSLYHAVFVTQRGFLFALPAGLYLIRKWMRFLADPTFVLSPTFLWLWGILPFFHAHSFVAISFWMGLTIVAERRLPWRLLIPSVLAAFILLRSLTTGSVNSSLGWDWFWTIDDPVAWVRNFGPWILLPIFTTGRWIRRKKWKQLGVAWTLTFFALNLKLAPWPWDQIKILIWVYLLWTVWAIQEYKWKRPAAFVFCVIFFWPGVYQWVSGWPSRTGRFEIQSAVDRASVQKLLSDLSPDDVVAADVDHRHPLLGLGQALALGYPGHAWSHGLPLEARSAGLKSILSGTDGGADFAREHKIRYVVWREDAAAAPPGAPTQTWEQWGWSEARAVGPWHLWRTSNAP